MSGNGLLIYDSVTLYLSITPRTPFPLVSLMIPFWRCRHELRVAAFVPVPPKPDFLTIC